MDKSNNKEVRSLTSIVSKTQEQVDKLNRDYREVVSVPTITTIDRAELVRMPDGYEFDALDNDGKLHNCKIQDDKFMYSANLTEG